MILITILTCSYFYCRNRFCSQKVIKKYEVQQKYNDEDDDADAIDEDYYDYYVYGI
jgi:hypothetical protein